MKEAKKRRKIIKALIKIQTVVGKKYKARWVQTVCLNLYRKQGLDDYGLEMHHNMESTEEILEVLAVAMIKECEKEGEIDLLSKVWKQVMSEHREYEQGTTTVQ